MAHDFPPRLQQKFYLTEGGTETEILYKWGFELREFAMFPLLDNPEADALIRNIYRRYFDVAEARDTGLLILGHDYRASPDWGAKLGYTPEGLAQMQRRTIRFLADMRAEYAGRVSDVYIAGCVGPRGDAYGGRRRDFRGAGRGLSFGAVVHAEGNPGGHGRRVDVQQRP